MHQGVRLRLLDVNAETVLPRREMRFQRQLRDQVVTGVLSPKRNGLGVPQIIEPLPELLAQGGEARLVGLSGAVGDKRRQHLEAWVMQHAVLDRKQDIVDCGEVIISGQFEGTSDKPESLVCRGI